MKTKLIILPGIITAFMTVVTVKAQSNEPAVKILPTTEEGIIKVLYAYSTDEFVHVNFYNEDGTIATDNVKARNFPKGFFKKYDINNITGNTFWIEVKAANLTATYKMTKSKKGTFVPLLEKTTYNHEVIAANN
jgi:hypothetical protein